MLVLGRKKDETIMIGDDIEITVVVVRGDNVRIGITAPRHVTVHRREVYDTIRAEKRPVDRTALSDILLLVDGEYPAQVTMEDIEKWSEDTCKLVFKWACAVYQTPDHTGVIVPDMPEVLK